MHVGVGLEWGFGGGADWGFHLRCLGSGKARENERNLGLSTVWGLGLLGLDCGLWIVQVDYFVRV